MKNPRRASDPIKAGSQKSKSRRISIVSVGLAVVGLASLLVGGSRPNGSALGITLVVLSVVALAASIVLFVTARSIQ